MHAGWFHLTANLLFLLAFAPRVEADLGRVGLLALFVGSGVLAGAAHVALVPLLVAPTIGASGAVAGVLGAHLVLAPRARLRVLVGPVPVRLPTWFVLTVWAALQVGYTAVVLRLAEYPVGVAYESHVVGFAVGVLCVAGALRLRPGLRGWVDPAGVRRAERRSGLQPPLHHHARLLQVGPRRRRPGRA